MMSIFSSFPFFFAGGLTTVYFNEGFANCCCQAFGLCRPPLSFLDGRSVWHIFLVFSGSDGSYYTTLIALFGCDGTETVGGIGNSSNGAGRAVGGHSFSKNASSQASKIHEMYICIFYLYFLLTNQLIHRPSNKNKSQRTKNTKVHTHTQ